MDDAMKKFMRDGLFKYPEARDVVDTFEAEVFRVLEHTLSNQSPEVFVADSKKLTTTRPSFEKGHYLERELVGSLPSGDPVTINLGVWWPQDSSKRRGISYIHFGDGPKRIRKSSYPELNSRVKQTTQITHTELSIEFSETTNLEEDLQLLVDELLTSPRQEHQT